MPPLSKAKRSAAAKKAGRTRKRNALANRKKEKTKLKKRAKKAKKAGKQSERKYVLQLKKKNNLVLNAKGIPDIFAHNREGWKFYEIKPHQMRTFKGRWYPASEKSRLLNCNQKREFKKLVAKGVDVYVVYYYRKKYGTKANPKYKFRYNEVKLQNKHFKHRNGPDPEKHIKIPEEIKHWMK